MQTTINGLHSCKPGNEPVIGQVKTFVIIHNPPKNGKKAWIKIKAANEENGGTPHRILSAEPTGYTDKFGNVSFNLEVEESSSAPTAFQQARSAMKEAEGTLYTVVDTPPNVEPPQSTVNTPPSRPNGGDGVSDTRKHLMKVANLYNLCIAAVDKAIAPNLPEIARTSEQFQATLASLFIEASSRRTTDGVNWWSYVDRMPDTPLAPSQSQQGKSGTTVPLSPKNICTCENTDGDNPLCPLHSS